MATDRLSQDAERDVVAEPSQPRRDDHLAQCRGPWTTASIIPARCTDAELLQGLGLSHSTFYRLKSRGTFRALEIEMPGANTQYSGAQILRWLAGERVVIEAPSSGRSFFGKKSAQVLAMPARRGRRPGRPRKVGAQQVVSVLHDRASVAPTLAGEKSKSVDGNSVDGGVQ